MKITFLGTNGWFSTHTGHSTCVMAETKDAYIILDAGGGFYKTHDLIKEDKPIFLLLTHVHMDHIEGLQVLPLFKFKQGMKILVEDSSMLDLQNIMRLPYMPAPKDLKMPTEIVPLSKAKNLPFKLDYLPLVHPVKTVGFRISAEDKILTFALDTGPCENLLKLSENADLMITECSFLPSKPMGNHHLTPEQAAQAAAEAKAKLLALIHFKADDYDTLEKRDEALVAASVYFTKTFAPYDGDFLNI